MERNREWGGYTDEEWVWVRGACVRKASKLGDWGRWGKSYNIHKIDVERGGSLKVQ